MSNLKAFVMCVALCFVPIAFGMYVVNGDYLHQPVRIS